MLKNDVVGYALLLGVSAIVLPEVLGSVTLLCAGMYGAEKILTK